GSGCRRPHSQRHAGGPARLPECRRLFPPLSEERTSMSADPHISGLPGTVIHDEVVPARAPWLRHIGAGQTLRIVDLEGNQAVDFLLYSAADDTERYSAQDTVAAQGSLF